jgi:hypothetical protein
MSRLKAKVFHSLKNKAKEVTVKIEPKIEEGSPLDFHSSEYSSAEPSQVSTYDSEIRLGGHKLSSDDTNIFPKQRNSKKKNAKFEEEEKPRKPRRKIPGGHITPEKIRCAKNIAKNYGRAIGNFAVSDIAKPYILPILNQEGSDMKAFSDFVKATKSTIKGIDTFRALLMIHDTEEDNVVRCKKVFRKIGEVFIKYFSVNWIFSSKIIHKLTYLKFRFKILRRIKNPELFTYLKG